MSTTPTPRMDAAVRLAIREAFHHTGQQVLVAGAALRQGRILEMENADLREKIRINAEIGRRIHAASLGGAGSLEEQLLVKMREHGGEFAHELARAWQLADSENAAILRKAFGALLHSYSKFL